LWLISWFISDVVMDWYGIGSMAPEYLWGGGKVVTSWKIARVLEAQPTATPATVHTPYSVRYSYTQPSINPE